MISTYQVLEWDALGMAIEAHEQPTVVTSELFHILEHLEYTTEEMRTVARTLFSYVD
jgi:hypothetical protein